MSSSLIETAKIEKEMRPAPIDPSWIVAGTPQARNANLSRSTDGRAWTVVWACSAGEFDWYYDCDETLMFLEGEAWIESDGLRLTRFGSGDVVLFKKGARARWRIDSHVRKIAFCHRPQPWLFGIALRIAARLFKPRHIIGPHLGKPARRHEQVHSIRV